MKSWWVFLAISVVLALHQDAWFWDAARPLVLGFLPVGLFYHAVYTLLVALFMVGLVRYAWPSELERHADQDGDVDS